MRAEATLTSVILYQVIIVLAVAPITALYLVTTGNLGLLADMFSSIAPQLVMGLALLMIAPVVLFLILPQLLTGAINWLLKKVGRAPLETELSSSRLLGLLLVAIVNWLLWGGSFAALTFGLNVYTTEQMTSLAPHLIASYPIAYAIGFLSFITPSGFGVREGAFYLLLTPLLGGGVITVVALAMRVWTTVGELLMAGLSVLWCLDRLPSRLHRRPAHNLAIEDRLQETQ